MSASPGLRTGLWAAVAVVAVFLTVVALAWGFQRRLIYLPAPGPVPDVAAALPGGEQVQLRTEDGLVLAAWWVPPGPRERGATVLVVPGNAGSRADRAPLARALSGEGFAVLLLEYRGYGDNPGSPSEEGLAADARAAHHHLVVDRGVEPERVLLLGESLGAAVAARLASERPVGGLVLRSPFTSLADVGARHYPVLPVRTLLRDRYEVLDRMPDLRVPTAVVLGTADEIVPPEQSREVAAAVAGPTTVVEVPGARHNDPALGSGAVLVDAVVGLTADGR
jgi:fermentation-respiration switch protein FrsA (DUF1100 family)